jgi:hypothetical protein
VRGKEKWSDSSSAVGGRPSVTVAAADADELPGVRISTGPEGLGAP